MKRITKLLMLLFLVGSLRGLSQVTLFYEDWSSNSFSANGWSFPNGQSNWDVGLSYTPFSNNAPNAYFNWAPSINNYSVSLLSPTINASAYTGQTLTLTYLLQQNSYSQSTLEEFKVEYKDVASSTWTVLNAYDNTTISPFPGVENYSVVALPLPGVVGQNFQLRFTAFGMNSFNINGWGLDSIVVEAPSCPASAALAILGNSVVCDGVASVLNASGANSYTWTPGGSNAIAQINNLTTATQFTLEGEISGCPSLTLSPVVFTVNVVPSPTVGVTASAYNICQGQTSTLTAMGASTYSWISIPSTTLASTTNSAINVNPIAKETFTLVGIAMNGCTDTTDVTINVDESPTFVTLAATSTAVCGGGNSQLMSLAAATDNYTVYPVPYSAINTPTSGVTVLCNGGTTSVTITNGNLDEGDWENINLPFNFNFFGIGYNAISVTTNGFINLGGGAPYTYNGFVVSLPDPFSARPCIGPVYSDLSFLNTGTIEYFTVGSTPNRTFVVNWTNAEFTFAGGTVTAQMQINETSNIIELHTGTVIGNPFFNMVEGIQDQSGFNAYTISGRNGVAYSVTTPDAYRFEPNGGTPPTYSWSPGTFLNSTSISSPSVTNITTSTVYSVTATGSNGCSTTQTIAINAGPTLPTLSITSTPSVICNGGGSATLTATGAVSVFDWDNGATTSSISVTQTSTTVYTLTAYNATGCDITETISLAVFNNPSILAVASSNTLCAGNFANLNVAGATTYSWSNGATTQMTIVTPTASITYSVIGFDSNGCSDTTFVPIVVNPLPITNLSASSGTACVYGPTLTLMGTPIGGNYSGTNVLSGSFTPGAVAGTFTPVYSVTNSTTGCTGTASVTIVVDPCTGIYENASELTGVNVYPNPTGGELYVELNTELEKKITVYDLTGRVLSERMTTERKVSFDISKNPAGVYFVRIQSNQAIKMVKIVRE